MIFPDPIEDDISSPKSVLPSRGKSFTLALKSGVIEETDSQVCLLSTNAEAVTCQLTCRADFSCCLPNLEPSANKSLLRVFFSSSKESMNCNMHSQMQIIW
uniref:Uncharacterized protein n=1 Tax=Sphaerodactylus townsendi TaxID=933632 RepID=A0ACB8ES56_9SAUR